jgi:bacterioferritin (cytochrome b1)
MLERASAHLALEIFAAPARAPEHHFDALGTLLREVDIGASEYVQLLIRCADADPSRAN